jgi:predicted transport protein
MIIKPVYGNIREAWKTEDRDFTPWLADDGLDILSNEIGIVLKKIDTEVSVGKYWADILVENEKTGEKIIIENQFGETDHDHLGKLLTYGAGLGSKILIWISEKFTDEHRATIDYLNSFGGLNIFALTIRVKKVNNDFIPEFDIVSKPNTWVKDIVDSETKNGRAWGNNGSMKPYLTVDEHRNNSFDGELFDEIRNYILTFGNVSEKSKANIIDYRHNTGFCSVHTQFKNQIVVYTKTEIPNPLPRIAEDKTDKNHLGFGDLRLNIKNKNEFEEAKLFIKKAYEEN